MIYLSTYTYTYTTTRIQVLDDHFELFLRCSSIEHKNREKLRDAVERQELSAIGIYIEDNGYRIAEVEFSVDWDEHKRQISMNGTMFDTDLPGFEKNVAPEAYVAAQRLVSAAKTMNKPVRSWILVSPEVRSNPQRHKQLCDELGYCYGSSVAPWENTPDSRERNINYLPEATVTQRTAR